MKGRFLSEERIEEFRQHLISEEKSENTMQLLLYNVFQYFSFCDSSGTIV